MEIPSQWMIDSIQTRIDPRNPSHLVFQGFLTASPFGEGVFFSVSGLIDLGRLLGSLPRFGGPPGLWAGRSFSTRMRRSLVSGPSLLGSRLDDHPAVLDLRRSRACGSFSAFSGSLYISLTRFSRRSWAWKSLRRLLTIDLERLDRDDRDSILE